MDSTELKTQGNKALASGKLDEAVELYTEAIGLDPENEVLYANRAQAYIKQESYGLAVQDASRAIELNPKYYKAYFRRATAKTAILDHKAALKDFKIVVDETNDPGAKVKLAECQKLIRRMAFQEAIRAEDAPSVLETISIRDISISAEDETLYGLNIDYDNEDKITNMSQGFIDTMISQFKNGKVLPRKLAYALVKNAMLITKQEPTMVEFSNDPSSPAKSSDKDSENPLDALVTVCGDTHGQFYDLLNIFDINGKPSQDHVYLFNGDFVDRGSWSVEIALTLYAYKILLPSRFFLNRGNHETDNMNKIYGFEGECNHKYGSGGTMFKLFSESFTYLPLATCISNSYLVLHGGLFSNDDVTLEDIRKVNRFSQPGQEGLMMEMLWTDPQDEPGRGPSKRGVGLQFGPDITKAFCDKNNLRAVIRSHEVRMEGYSVEHDGRLITVFSAPNYCDSTGNEGALINIKPGTEQTLEYKTFQASPHPPMKPMAYANRLMA